MVPMKIKITMRRHLNQTKGWYSQTFETKLRKEKKQDWSTTKVFQASRIESKSGKAVCKIFNQDARSAPYEIFSHITVWKFVEKARECFTQNAKTISQRAPL